MSIKQIDINKSCLLILRLHDLCLDIFIIFCVSLVSQLILSSSLFLSLRLLFFFLTFFLHLFILFLYFVLFFSSLFCYCCCYFFVRNMLFSCIDAQTFPRVKWKVNKFNVYLAAVHLWYIYFFPAFIFALFLFSFSMLFFIFCCLYCFGCLLYGMVW